MKKRLYYLLCGLLGVMAVLLVFLPQRTIAQTTPLEINLVTGDEVGKYYSLARDIEKFALKNNLDVDVIATRGSLQNVHDVFHYESVPLGIIQGDVLGFLNTFANDDEEVRRQAESLRSVLPLHQEEIHLIARQDINSVGELAQKRVSIGDEGSGTSTTATNLLYQWGINPKELVTMDVRRSIDALRDQEIDAMFYVLGMPAQVLENQIFPEDSFHLIPLSLPSTPEDEFYNLLYGKASIPAGTYTWQKEPVETLAVQSFLVTSAEEDCQSVTPVAKLIKENLSWFQENGDPVWQGIELKVSHGREPERVSQCSVF